MRGVFWWGTSVTMLMSFWVRSKLLLAPDLISLALKSLSSSTYFDFHRSVHFLTAMPITTMILRPLLHTQSLRSIRGFQRPFSVIAIQSSFPASLLRYNSRPRSSLFDYNKRHEREDEPIDDGVEVSENGLVCPAVSNRLPCLCSIGHTFSRRTC